MRPGTRSVPGWRWARGGRGGGRPRGRCWAGTRGRWSGTWGLFGVRPARRVKGGDGTWLGAAAEAALEAGWRYSVVAGWRPHVRTGIDALSAQRRDLQDRLGLRDRLLDAVSAGPAAFGDLVGAMPLPAVARAHALHLLWRRRLGTDLSCPLGDASLVWLAGGNG